MNSARQKIIGIECGLTQWRAMLIETTKTRINILGTFSFPLDDQPIHIAINNLYKKLRKQSRRIILGIPHHITMCQDLMLDRTLSPYNILTILEQNAKNYFGSKLNELFYDFGNISALNTNEQSCIRVVAVRRNEVINYIKIIKNSGFQLHAIDIDLFAAARCLEFNKKKSISTTLIKLDHTMVGIIAILKGDIIFAKSIKHEGEISGYVARLMHYYQTSPQYQTPQQYALCGTKANEHADTLTSLLRSPIHLLTPTPEWASTYGLSLWGESDR